MTISKINIYEGLEDFITAIRIELVALLKKNFGHNWPINFRESLSPIQRENWDISIKKGIPIEMIIDYQHLKPFAENYKNLLIPYFPNDVMKLPKWFDEIAKVRHSVFHFNEAELVKEGFIERAWTNMIQIAEAFEMKDIKYNLSVLRGRKEFSEDFETVNAEVGVRSEEKQEQLFKMLIERVEKRKQEAEERKQDMEKLKFLKEYLARLQEEEEKKHEKNYNTQVKHDIIQIEDNLEKPKSENRKGKAKSNARIIIFILGMFAISYFLYSMISSGKSKENVQNISHSIIEQETSQRKDVTVPVIQECESNNTGDYSFKNTTTRKIYLFIDRGTWWKTIEIEPKQTSYESNLSVDKYSYTYSYYKGSNFTNNDVKGSFVVEKCTTSNLDLILPTFKWYKVTGDGWTEINIPPNGYYAIVAPYKSFMFKYEGDAEEHYTNSWLCLPNNIDKIYVKNGFEGEMEVSVQSYIPR